MNENTMDVTGSLRKISKELLELEHSSREEILTHLEGASWLITYIADALDVELLLAAERGRRLAMKQLGEGQGGEWGEYTVNLTGQRIYETVRIEGDPFLPGNEENNE